MAEPIRLMHFADTHFGVENYGRLDPATGLNTRLIDFRESLERAIDDALGRGIDAAIFAGDAYKSRDPSQTHQREFAKCIRRLTDQGIPVVMLTGNHDVPNVRGRAHAIEIYQTLGSERLTIISKVEVRRIETRRGTFQVAAMPYLMRGFMMARDEFLGKTVDEIRKTLEEKYHLYLSELAEQVDRSIPAVLMGHFWVREARLSEWQQGYFNINEPQVEISWLAQEGVFDYVALGHIHKYQDLNRSGQPPVVYSGSPDYIDFGERREKKGYVYVALQKGHTDHEFVQIPPSRGLVEIDVDADTDTPTETILAAIAGHKLEGAIARLTYRLPSSRLPALREKEIRDALAPAFLVAGIRREIQRDQRERTRVISESLDPLVALDHYLEQNPRLRSNKEALMAYAGLLMEELRREESVA